MVVPAKWGRPHNYSLSRSLNSARQITEAAEYGVAVRVDPVESATTGDWCPSPSVSEQG
jgi:hypothetical protein